MNNRSYINSHQGHPHYISQNHLTNLKLQLKSASLDLAKLETLRLLTDQTKYRICLLLSKVKELPVTDISVILALPQSRASHALLDLKKAGLIYSYRCGKLICYSLSSDNLIVTKLLKIFSAQK